MRWTPGESFDWTLSYQQDRLGARGPVFFAGRDQFGLLTGLAAALGDPNYRVGRFDYTSQSGRAGGNGVFDDSTEKRLTSTAIYDWNGYTFTALTGYYRNDKKSLVNADALPRSPIALTERQTDNQASQELRVTSPKVGRFDYVLGALYLHDAWTHNTGSDTVAPIPISGRVDNLYSQLVNAESVFGQVNIDVVQNLRASVGVRGTGESKEGEFARYTLVPGLLSVLLYPPIAPGNLSRRENDLDGSVGLQYQFDREKMLYTSYSKGTKGGGYQDTPTSLAGAEYKPEIARTAEIGAKWGFGRTGHINGAVFYTKIRDFQLGTFNGASWVVNNLDIDSKGAEFDALWAPLPGLTAVLNGTYSDTWNTQTGAPNFYGTSVPFAPRWTGKAALGYGHSLGEYEISSEASVDIRGQVLLAIQQTGAERLPPSDAFAKANLRVALSDPKSGLEIAVVGRNLNNRRTTTYGYQAFPNLPGTAIFSSDMPRTIALQVSIKH